MNQAFHRTPPSTGSEMETFTPRAAVNAAVIPRRLSADLTNIDGTPLLTDCAAKYGAQVLPFDNLHPQCLPEYVTVHAVLDDNFDDISDQIFIGIRDCLFAQGWDLSRQRILDQAIHVYLYPVKLESPAIGFHATRSISVGSILKNGLQPGLPDRTNTDRLDPIGNIYFASVLGARGDVASSNCGTAHWWLEHLSVNNRFNDPAWQIIQVDFAQNSGLKWFQDIWSNSGRIVRTSSPITKGLSVVG